MKSPSSAVSAALLHSSIILTIRYRSLRETTQSRACNFGVDCSCLAQRACLLTRLLRPFNASQQPHLWIEVCFVRRLPAVYRCSNIILSVCCMACVCCSTSGNMQCCADFHAYPPVECLHQVFKKGFAFQHVWSLRRLLLSFTSRNYCMISLLYTLTSTIQETTAANLTSSRTAVVYMQVQNLSETGYWTNSKPYLSLIIASAGTSRDTL